MPFPEYWLARPSGMPVAVGTNRINFNWDLRYDAPKVFAHEFEINANPGLTPASPEGPLALPGARGVRLTVDGARYEQKVMAKSDRTSSPQTERGPLERCSTCSCAIGRRGTQRSNASRSAEPTIRIMPTSDQPRLSGWPLPSRR